MFKKLKYKIDNIFSRGLPALLLFLALISILVIITISLLVWFLNITNEPTLVKQMWEYFTIVGTGDPTDSSDIWAYKLITQIVVLSGLFVTSVLIGLISATFKNKFDQLKEGKSEVIEKDHTVIIGWNGQTITIIKELIEANLSQNNPSIVILGNINKSDMDYEIRKKVPNSQNTKIICRKGNPIDIDDLKRVSLKTCKSIIILPPRNTTNADTAIIKIILAIINDPYRKKSNYNIVAQISNKKNLIIGDIIGKDELTLIHANDMIAKISVQTCRQPGLSTVYTDLLDFNGVEIYFKKEKDLINQSFENAVLSYDSSLVIGVLKNNIPILNPAKDIIIDPSDELIFIAEDNDDIHLSETKKININDISFIEKKHNKLDTENILIIGWNDTVDFIINELNKYNKTNSKVHVAGNSQEINNRIKNKEIIMDNQIVSYTLCETTDRTSLEKLDFNNYHHVIIISCKQAFNREQADANTILTLMHVRDIAKKNNYSFSIVSEILDTKNRDLIINKKVDDFVASEKIISFILAQVSERKELNLIFNEIFKAEGSEVYFKPITNYINVNSKTDFYTIIKASMLRDEIALGYRIFSQYHDENKNFGIVLNPKKSQEYLFSKNDSIIVLAED